jgi:hypothetical protein
MKSIIDKQLDILLEKFPDTKISPRADGTIFVTIHDFAVPSGWNKSTTSVSFLVPVGYPAARPDCFWADPDLTLVNGGTPDNTAVNDSHGVAGESKLWFSYHLSNWNANTDDLLTYVRVIRGRLEDVR